MGERVKERRLQLNITQEELASSLGVTPQYISYIEQDKGMPSIQVLMKLAETLGVSMDYLACGKESVVTDIIPAIKADSKLSLKAKESLISLVEELYGISERQGEITKKNTAWSSE